MLTAKQQEGLIRHITHYDTEGQKTFNTYLQDYLQHEDYDKSTLESFFKEPNSEDYWFNLETDQRDKVMQIIIGHMKKYNPKKAVS